MEREKRERAFKISKRREKREERTGDGRHKGRQQNTDETARKEAPSS